MSLFAFRKRKAVTLVISQLKYFPHKSQDSATRAVPRERDGGREVLKERISEKRKIRLTEGFQ